VSAPECLRQRKTDCSQSNFSGPMHGKDSGLRDTEEGRFVRRLYSEERLRAPRSTEEPSQVFADFLALVAACSAAACAACFSAREGR
jgi:hypothetical protein